MKISRNRLRSIIRSVIKESYGSNRIEEMEDMSVTHAFRDTDHLDHVELSNSRKDYARDILNMCKNICSNGMNKADDQICLELRSHYRSGIDKLHALEALQCCIDELKSDDCDHKLCIKCASVLCKLCV